MCFPSSFPVAEWTVAGLEPLGSMLCRGLSAETVSRQRLRGHAFGAGAAGLPQSRGGAVVWRRQRGEQGFCGVPERPRCLPHRVPQRVGAPTAHSGLAEAAQPAVRGTSTGKGAQAGIHLTQSIHSCKQIILGPKTRIFQDIARGREEKLGGNSLEWV